MNPKDKNDRIRFGTVMNFAGEAYSEVVSEKKVEAYFLVLEPFPIEAVERAIMQVCREVIAFKIPPVAEVVNRIVGTLNERAEQAFAICLRNSIFDKSVEFEDTAIGVAIEVIAGSWEQWCDWARFMPEEEFLWKKKDWIKHYLSNSHAPGPKKYFMGYVEKMGRLQGAHYQPVVRRVALDGSTSEQKLLDAPPTLKQLAAQNDEPFALPDDAMKMFEDTKRTLRSIVRDPDALKKD